MQFEWDPSKASANLSHVHVAHPGGEAKFWLAPQVTLASHTGLSAKQLREAQAVVEAHIEEIRNAWHRHFGS